MHRKLLIFQTINTKERLLIVLETLLINSISGSELASRIVKVIEKLEKY